VSEAPFWTDSHNHLVMEPFDADREAVVQRAFDAGVRRMLLVGTNPEDWGPAAALSARHGFRSTAGLHPHEASRWGAELAGALAAALEDPAVAAVGEIGLDYHYEFSPRKAQLEAFGAQLAMARERSLPVVVHSREAFEDTLAMLREGSVSKGVVHCFTYGPDQAEAFLGLGLALSLSGIATFPKAPELRETARRAPGDRLLVETDAPYLAPAPFRGKRCEPAQVAVVGRHLAAFLGVPEAEFARRTSENAARLFGWAPPAPL
jgi:TatD DNase family protein